MAAKDPQELLLGAKGSGRPKSWPCSFQDENCPWIPSVLVISENSCSWLETSHVDPPLRFLQLHPSPPVLWLSVLQHPGYPSHSMVISDSGCSCTLLCSLSSTGSYNLSSASFTRKPHLTSALDLEPSIFLLCSTLQAWTYLNDHLG